MKGFDVEYLGVCDSENKYKSQLQPHIQIKLLEMCFQKSIWLPKANLFK